MSLVLFSIQCNAYALRHLWTTLSRQVYIIPVWTTLSRQVHSFISGPLCLTRSIHSSLDRSVSPGPFIHLWTALSHQVIHSSLDHSVSPGPFIHLWTTLSHQVHSFISGPLCLTRSIHITILLLQFSILSSLSIFPHCLSIPHSSLFFSQLTQLYLSSSSMSPFGDHKSLMEKVQSYIVLYPVLGTVQSALHFTPWQTCSFQRHFNFSGKNSALL